MADVHNKATRSYNMSQIKSKDEQILNLLSQSYIPTNLRPLATECFNTFDKGPQRTVIFLLMLSDIRAGRLDPGSLTNSTLGSIYEDIAGSYQSPKVIHIYAQQSFGNVSAMPIDTWIDTFFKWPLNVYSTLPKKNKISAIFNNSTGLGKLERLLWVAAQARKVHSSACNDAIWCTKLASDREPRGANPLACKICLSSIRDKCPAYSAISNMKVVFNEDTTDKNSFVIKTSAGNNQTTNQKFISCKGHSIYREILDDFSPSDDPTGLAPYPNTHHNGSPMTVVDFVATY